MLQGARGEMPLPSYADELARQRWLEVDDILTEGCAVEQFPVKCQPGVPERAIARADAFQQAVRQDAGLEYLAGLASRYAGQEDEAIRRYRHAIQLDAKRAEAWYDLGEIYQTRADLPAAREAFEQVATLRSTGELAWIGPWRLAEVGAMAHDANAFERDLKEALRRGFSFRHVAGQPHWKAFYADPTLHDTLDKMLTVYAEPDVRALFEEK
jgi:tetratricopeptide (TPR) repeat protein